MKYSKRELEQFTGNISQISSITELEYAAGKARGMRAWDVRPGNGLAFTLLPDKCLDIAQLSYKGININWQSKNGFSGWQNAYPVLNEFDRYFSGGMLLTCGLKNTGYDYIDENGSFQHLHGRIGVTPCEQSWHREYFEGDEYVLEAGGLTRDSVLGGHNLTLARSLKTTMGQSEILITDTLENHEPEGTDYLILYHFNFGFPFLDPDIQMGFPPAESPVKPRTEADRNGIGEWCAMAPPVDGYEEQCFFHDLETDQHGWSEVSLENKKLGIGVKLSYEKKSLPILMQWKSLRAGEYVLGIEPGNSYASSMRGERENGVVGHVEAYGKQEFRIKLRFYDV